MTSSLTRFRLFRRDPTGKHIVTDDSVIADGDREELRRRALPTPSVYLTP